MHFRRFLAAVALLAIASVPLLRIVCEVGCAADAGATVKVRADATPHCPMHSGSATAVANDVDCGDHDAPVAIVQLRRAIDALSAPAAAAEVFFTVDPLAGAPRSAPAFIRLDTSPPHPHTPLPLRI